MKIDNAYMLIYERKSVIDTKAFAAAVDEAHSNDELYKFFRRDSMIRR